MNNREKERKEKANKYLMEKGKNIITTKDAIKIYPEKIDGNGFLICPFCGKSDCLRKNKHEWYCTKTKQYITFKGVKYL